MKSIGAITAAALIALGSFQSADALTCYGLTSDNRMISFDSSSPGTVTNNVALVMPDPAYSVVGIDLRTTTQTEDAANPGVGSLWGICYNNSENFRLCVINPTTGVVTFVGGVLVMDDSANADAFGFGFDPARDRFQFISVQTNYEIDPNTVTRVQRPNITPGFPAHSGAAFSTASFGGSSQFYNISRQMSPRTLQTSTNINAGGALTAINTGGMGADVNAPLGIDIEGNLFLLANSDDVSLYQINRNTGTKSLVGAIGAVVPGFRGLAIVPASFPPTLPVTVKIKGKKKITTTLAKATIKGTAKSDAGIAKVEYRVGNKGKFKKAKGTKKWTVKAKLKPGVNKLQVRAIGGNDVVSKPAKVKIIRQ